MENILSTTPELCQNERSFEPDLESKRHKHITPLLLYGEYKSLIDFMASLRKYEIDNDIRLAIGRSVLLSGKDFAKNLDFRYQDRIIGLLYYKYFEINCQHGEERSSVAIKRKTTTKKYNCKMKIKIQRIKNKLVINMLHEPHRPECKLSYKKARLEEEHRLLADYLSELGVSNSMIAQNLTSLCDSYVSTKDVYNLGQRNTKRICLDEALDILKKEGIAEKLIESGKTYGIFYQTDYMMRNYKRFGDILCIDSTFKLTNLNWTFFIALGYDNNRKAIPFFTFLLHNESYGMIRKGLLNFGKYNDVSITTYIMTDKDLASRKALKHVFTKAQMNLCVFIFKKTLKTQYGLYYGMKQRM